MSALVSSLLKQDDEVRLSAFAQAECLTGDECLIQVSLHTPEQAEEVERMAQAADPEASFRDAYRVGVRVSRGERLFVHLGVKGLEVYEPSREFTWDGSPTSAKFVVGIPEGGGPSRQIVKAILTRQGVPLGHLMFTLKVKVEEEVKAEEEVKVKEVPQTFVPHRKAYICYASEDRAEVAKRVQMLRQAGIHVLMDVIGMKPDMNWEEQVYRYIDQADVFYIFWSEAAANSPWVTREVAYALAHKARRADGRPEIVPVPLSAPIPPPPAYLSDLPFNDAFLYFIKAEGEAQK